MARTDVYLYDLETTCRFRLTEYKIACVRPGVLCASQHCRKFLKVIFPAAYWHNTAARLRKMGKTGGFYGRGDNKAI